MRSLFGLNNDFPGALAPGIFFIFRDNSGIFRGLNNKTRIRMRVYKYLVEMTGFEPATSASRTQRSTKLSHISIS